MKPQHLIVLTLFVLIAQSSAQPQKGMAELSLSGPLFQKYFERDYTIISPTIQVGYFTGNRFELSGLFNFVAIGRNDLSKGYQFGIGIKQHFLTDKKNWPFLGIDVRTILGDYPGYYKDTPLQVIGRLGLKYWPMEGGAVVTNFFVMQQWPESIEETTYGFDIGLLIRIK